MMLVYKDMDVLESLFVLFKNGAISLIKDFELLFCSFKKKVAFVF